MFLILFFLVCSQIDNTNAVICDQMGKEFTCPQGQLCFRDGGTTGCKDSFACLSKTKDQCPNSADAEECCCSTDRCNQKGNQESSDYTITIVVIVVAVLLLVLIISALLYWMLVRKSKKAGYTSIAPPASDNSVRSSSYKWGVPMEDSLIEQEDRTEELVQAIISEPDKEELFAHIETPPIIKGQPTFYNVPKIVKVITYGTTDHITMLEDIASAIDITPSNSRDVAGALLRQMVAHGAQQFPFDVPRLKRVLQTAAGLIMQEGSLLEIPVPCIIYGDIHGQYSDLLRWFNLNGWPNRTRSVFLGDFVDRGSHGIEVIALMACLKVLFPQHIFFCRGNHEEENLNKAYSFYDEVKLRFDDNNASDNIYLYFKKLFIHLPLAALVGEKILGMHGGLSPKLNKLKDIRDIKRPIDDFEVGSLACDLVWSDPDLCNGAADYRPNLDREPKIGIGQLFSSSAVESTCERLGIDMVIRGHQTPLHGYARWAKGRLITLFSAPGYKGRQKDSVNMGACIEARADGDLIIKQIKVTEEFRRKRIDDVESRKRAVLERLSSRETTSR